ncbi:hypothetical protein OSB04_016189 [Centaurea solstitialis]|uniref:Uncharacterized protein n=1 Tax=Centaurea solstitialis TaxID=347529 RepID=A0AA38T228_9ASTR|nr:hypothetical protein OSB04_016189 [Centaurea solstitialis]
MKEYGINNSWCKQVVNRTIQWPWYEPTHLIADAVPVLLLFYMSLLKNRVLPTAVPTAKSSPNLPMSSENHQKTVGNSLVNRTLEIHNKGCRKTSPAMSGDLRLLPPATSASLYGDVRRPAAVTSGDLRLPLRRCPVTCGCYLRRRPPSGVLRLPLRR